LTHQIEVRLEQLSACLAAENKERENLDAISAEYNTRHAEITATVAEYDRELEAASASRRNTDKEQGAQRAVERLQQMFPGVHGRLIDLVDATQKKFEVAVCAALGHHMNSVVVNTGDDCKECMRHLATEGKYRMTFLALDRLVVSKPSDELRAKMGA
jgi:structural maintenance of chromosome 1